MIFTLVRSLAILTWPEPAGGLAMFAGYYTVQ